MKKYKIGLISAMLIWGSIGIFVKNIDFSSSQIALVRAVLGSIFLMCFSLISKQSISKKNIKANFWVLIASGICLGFNWIFLFQAYSYTTIAISTICYYLAPIIVTFLSPILFKEKLNGIKVFCIIGAMIGMFFVVGIDGKSIEGNSMIGILYGIGAACFYASVVILNKHLKEISGRESATIQLSISAIFLIPYVLLGSGISFNGVNTSSIVLLVILGILHTGIPYLIYFTCIQKLPSQTVAIYSYVDPISAIIMSSIILSESMNLLQVIGGILILGSTFISEIYGTKNEQKDLIMEIGMTEDDI